MDTEVWVWIGVLTVTAVFGIVCKVIEIREAEAFQKRLRDDPEFARRYHESRSSDDWEDMGYFDGR